MKYILLFFIIPFIAKSQDSLEVDYIEVNTLISEFKQSIINEDDLEKQYRLIESYNLRIDEAEKKAKKNKKDKTNKK